MKKIFKNPNTQKLRAGWRILFFILIFWLLASSIFIIKPLFGDITRREFLESYSVIIIFILAVSASIAVAIARKFFDKRSVKSLGLTVNRQALKDIVFGFLLSGVMAGLFFLILTAFDLIEFNGFNFGEADSLAGQPFDYISFISVMSIGSLTIILFEHIMVGYWEELVFRGYVFQNMIDGMGLKISILISCVIYGLVHFTNPNASLLSTAIIMLFGFLRIYGYLATKMLWLSMGMHMGWNYFQGPIFGFAASGREMATLINQTAAGPNWLSGGDFGPEGSILIIPIILFALLVMRWWAKKSSVEY